jgi:hypothetical protein
MESLLKKPFKFDIPRNYQGFRALCVDSTESLGYLGTSNGFIEVVDLKSRKSIGNKDKIRF